MYSFVVDVFVFAVAPSHKLSDEIMATIYRRYCALTRRVLSYRSVRRMGFCMRRKKYGVT